MTRRWLLAQVVVLVIAVMQPAPAGWFERSTDSPNPGPGAASANERPLRKLSPEEAPKFEKLVTSRDRLTRQVAVLREILTEKQQEIARFEANLARNFDVDPKQNYQYDQSSHALYLLSAVTADTPAADDKPPLDAVVTNAVDNTTFTRALHRQMSAQEAGAFGRVVSAKKLTQTQQKVVELLLREKMLERQKANRALTEHYGIDAKKNYRYDRESRTVFVKSKAKP